MKKLWKRIHPQNNRWILMSLLLALLLAGQVSFAHAQSGVPIIDSILAFIDDYKLAIAMVGIAVVALGLLAKPVFPKLWDSHRDSIVYMIVGGILLTMIPTIAALIVG